MNREGLRTLVLVVVCALAVIVASATISTTVEPSQGGGGSGTGGGSSVGVQGGENTELLGDPNTSSGLANLSERGAFAFELCLPWLKTWWALGGIAAALVGLWLLGKRRTDGLASAAMTLTVAIPIGFLYYVLTGCRDINREPGVPETLANQSAGGGGSGTNNPEVPEVVTNVPTTLYVLVGIGLLAVIVVAIADREQLEAALAPVRKVTARTVEDDEDEPDYRVDTGAVGRAAGRAADRIEDGTDVDNEVYRAWTEMTRYLEVDHPESSTPAEFAGAAIEAGMETDDVEELTQLFEEVRYGGQQATDDRERRAVEALRRIEAEYADAEDGTDDAGDRPGGDAT